MPSQVKAVAHIGNTGVDEQVAIVCQFACSVLAVLDSAVRTRNQHNFESLAPEGSAHGTRDLLAQ